MAMRPLPAFLGRLDAGAARCGEPAPREAPVRTRGLRPVLLRFNRWTIPSGLLRMPHCEAGGSPGRPGSPSIGRASTLTDLTPDEQVEDFIAKFTPPVASLTRAVLAKMRARLPGAVELVYDNYNALVIGFSPTERASEAVFSIA